MAADAVFQNQLPRIQYAVENGQMLVQPGCQHLGIHPLEHLGRMQQIIAGASTKVTPQAISEIFKQDSDKCR